MERDGKATSGSLVSNGVLNWNGFGEWRAVVIMTCDPRVKHEWCMQEP